MIFVKLNYITIMVRNLEKSLDFYEKLISLKPLREMDHPQEKIVFLANQQGETMLELIQFDKAEKVTARGMVIGFVADRSLAALKEQAQVMGYQPSEIVSRPPKPAFFTMTDPDGLIVEIAEG